MDNLSREINIAKIAATIQNDPQLQKEFSEDPSAVRAEFDLKDMTKKDFVARVNAAIKSNEELELSASQSTEEVSKLNPEAMKTAGNSFGNLPGQNSAAGTCAGTTACGTFAYPAGASFGSIGTTACRASAASVATAGSVASFAGRTTKLTRAGTIGTAACLPRRPVAHRFGSIGSVAGIGGTTTNLTSSTTYGTVASFARSPILSYRPAGSAASVATYGNTRIPVRPFSGGTYYCVGRPGATVATTGAIIRGGGYYPGGACAATRHYQAASVPRIPPVCFGSVGSAAGTLASGCQATTGKVLPGGKNKEETKFAQTKAVLSLKSILYAGDPVGDNFELRIQVGKSEPPYTWKGKMAHGKRKNFNKEVFDGTFTYEVNPDAVGLPLTISLTEIDRIDRLHDKTVLRAIIDLPLKPTKGEITKQSVDLQLTEIDEKPGDDPSIGKFSFNFWCEQLK